MGMSTQAGHSVSRRQFIGMGAAGAVALTLYPRGLATARSERPFALAPPRTLEVAPLRAGCWC